MPSFANGSLEIAPALANVNFDFSLFKVDAPKEFRGVGDALSKIRRENAESGMPHITARKLGALFERLLPPTPSLFNAYGRRASEISESSSIDAEGRKSYGVFASVAGADATSLWAAATSGQGAIAVHLLACMLARIWDGPQATSIWMEIIEKRQKEICRDFEETNIADMGSLSAAKQPIAREQIREWDASARAWLRAADSVKKVQQKQLSLIIDNIKLPVNGKTETYGSVIEAWKNSLAQMDGLVNGISQNARHGDILLALSAWHLFPDMMVVMPTTTEIRQHDPIFSSGGMLTLGLKMPDNAGCSGVYWSLPLARLRHYGAPVTSVQTMDSRERSRISVDEFLQVALGCFLQGWGEVGKDTVRSLRWLRGLASMLENTARNGHSSARTILEAEGSWFNLMLIAAKHYLEYSDADRKTATKLIILGRKHGNNFLGIANRPMLGLLEKGIFVKFLKTEEERICYLRRVAKDVAEKLDLNPTKIFIRYAHKHPQCDKYVFEYASALPWQAKRKYEQLNDQSRRHRRWLFSGGDLQHVLDPVYHARLDRVYRDFYGDFQRKVLQLPPDYWTWHMNVRKQQLSLARSRDLGLMSHFQDSETPLNKTSAFDPILETDLSEIALGHEIRRMKLLSSGESVSLIEDEFIEDFQIDKMGLYWRSQSGDTSDPVWFKCIWGDPDSAALFVPENLEASVARDPITDSHNLYDFFEGGVLNADLVVTQLANTFRLQHLEHDPYLSSLKALSTAAELYKKLAHASIDIRVFQQKLYRAGWAKNIYSSVSLHLFADNLELADRDMTIQALRPFGLDRARAFACLVMFETGTHNPTPDLFGNVMAMSSADSLYVSEALLCDPFEEKAFGAIRHIVGNIGRPGITFLVPPKEPMVREAQISDWPVINHETFTGETKDSFKNTTLHLSFTSAESPVNLGFSGAQDTELHLLETLISVHDRGKWVADLDIFESLDKVRSVVGFEYRHIRLPPCSADDHSGAQPLRYTMTCIDDWLELLDPSENPVSIVRASRNWQARLAATAMSIALGNTTVVCPSSTCWRCFEEILVKLDQGTKRVVAIA